MSTFQNLVCIILGHDYVSDELMLGKLDQKKVKVRRCERCNRVLVPT